MRTRRGRRRRRHHAEHLPDEALAEVAGAVVEAAADVSGRLGAGTLPDLPPWRPVVEVQAVMEPPLELRPAGAADELAPKPRRRRPRPRARPGS
jgi:hypothetical protein